MGERRFFHQTLFGGPGSPVEETGNCWATAVAVWAGWTEDQRDELHSLIIAASLDVDDPDREWWNVTQRFVARHADIDGLTVIYDLEPFDSAELLIATGPSPRGDWRHCVIVDGDGDLVFDPQPSGEGLDGDSVEFIAAWNRSDADTPTA